MIDFTSEEQNELFAIVASVLHVGNIDFKISQGGVGLVDTKDVDIVTKVRDFCFITTVRDGFTGGGGGGEGEGVHMINPKKIRE